MKYVCFSLNGYLNCIIMTSEYLYWELLLPQQDSVVLLPPSGQATASRRETKEELDSLRCVRSQAAVYMQVFLRMGHSNLWQTKSSPFIPGPSGTCGKFEEIISRQISVVRFTGMRWKWGQWLWPLSPRGLFFKALLWCFIQAVADCQGQQNLLCWPNDQV